MGSRQPSVTGRAILALALAVLFYALVAVVVVVLARIAYLGISGESKIPRMVVTVCVAGAALLIYASLPRRTRFVPPGPELHPADQPAIWMMIEHLARETAQPVPTTAYWSPQANASVTSVGGFLGLKGRRVLELGFPLAVAMDADALRAVLAHEFGHFHAGDVKLGPLVYVTGSAVRRATNSLRVAARALPLLHILTLPFLGFASLYLRITEAVSRRQEYSADALAARLVSREAIARALLALARYDRSWGEYLEADVAPLLSAKRRPPITSGWQTYLNSPEVRDELARKEEREGERATKRRISAGPYDTHPSNPDRLRALGYVDGRVPESVQTSERPSALEIEGIDALELDLIELMTENPGVRGYPAIGWDRVIPELTEPQWREALTRYGAGIRGTVVEHLPARNEDLTELGRKLNPRDAKDPAGAQQRAASVLIAALAVGLRRRGFALDSRPGTPLRAQRGDETVDVEDVVRGVAAGRITPSDWADRCRALGIEGLDLGAEAAAYLA